MKPPPKRGPDFGHTFFIGGEIVPLSAVALQQPGAPSRYVIESPIGVDHQVRWDAEDARWTDELSDESQGGQASLDKMPAAGSIPASSADSGASPASSGMEIRGHPDSSEQLSGPDAKLRGKPTFKKPVVESRRSARPARSDLREEVKEVSYAPDQGKPSHPTREASEAPFSDAFVFGVPAKAATQIDRPSDYRDLAPHLRPLFIELDRARDKFGAASARADADAMERLGPAYYAAIAAVDQADPGFYRGRRQPVKELPRHVVPDSVDLAAISARLGATLPDYGEAA